MKLLVIALITLFALTLTFTSVQAQTPTLTVERLPDNSLRLTWENIPTSTRLYTFSVTEDGVNNLIGGTVFGTTDTFIPETPRFERINNAERVGVLGHAAGILDPDVAIYRVVPAEIQQPTVTVERLVNNSIKVSWEAIQTDATEDYGIRITEGVIDSAELISSPSDTSEFTFEPSDDLYERVTDAQRVGVHGTVSGVSTDQTWGAVPPKPTLTAERLADNSIELSWENIDTSPLGAYQIFVITGTTETRIEGAIVSGASVVIDSDHLAFNQINDADSVGIAGSRSDGSGGTEFIYKTFDAVPDEVVLPTIHFERRDDGSISVSWFKAVLGVRNAIWITEDGRGDTEIVYEPPTIPHIFLSDDPLFDRVNNAQRIGVSNLLVGFLDVVVYTEIPPPPAPTHISNVEHTTLFNGDVELSFTPLVAATFVITYGDKTINHIVDVEDVDGPATVTLDTDFGFNDSVVISVGTEVVERLSIHVVPGIPELAGGVITDTTVALVWAATPGGNSYELFRDGVSLGTTTELTFTDTGLTPDTNYSYTIKAIYDDSLSSDLSEASDTFTKVSAEPSVTAVRQADNSILVTWEGIPTTTSYFVASDVRGTATLIEQVSSSPYTILTSHTDFDQINSASRIKVNGVVDGTPGAPAFAPVPAQITPVTPDKITGVTHDVLPNGSTNIKFTPTVAATFVITYSDQTINHVVDVGDVDVETIVNINTVFGFKGDVVISISDEEVGRLSIQVRPAPPTLSAVDTTATDVELSWTAPSGAVSYELFRDDDPTPIETTTALTFTDTGLTAGVTYTYHVISVDDSDQESDASNVLTVTPVAGPIVTAERLDDNSIKLTWDGIHTADPFNVGFFYQVWLTEGGVDDALNIFTETSGDTTLTIPPDDGDFDRINRAQKIGIAGNNPFGSDLTLVPVPPIPSVTAERLAGDAIKLTWENIRTDNGFYRIHIDNTASFQIPSSTSEFTFDPTHSHFDRANSADTVGVSGSIGGEVVDQRFVPVPASILPTVTAVRQADDSILVTWSNIPTDNGYGLKILEDGAADTLHVDILVEYFTIPTTHRHFDRINNAESIGINGIAGTSSTATHYIPVPESILPALTVERLSDNSIKMSWKNIRSDTGNYDIWVTIDDANEFLFQRSSSTSEFTFELGNHHYTRVSDAERLGISGYDGGNRVDQQYEDIPPLLTVTLGIPTLSSGGITDTSVVLSWNAPSGAVSYELFRSSDGSDPSSIETTTGLTFTDTGLTPETAYDYHVVSIGSTENTSDSSNVETITTLPTPPVIPTVSPLTFTYNTDGSVDVSFTTSDAGDYTISYTIADDNDEESVDSVTVTVTDDQVNEPTKPVTLLTKPGYTGTVEVSFDDTVYASAQLDSKKDGNSDKWKTKPTFGSSWGTQTQLVDAGFVFNGIPLTITDNWHTDFSLTSSIIGDKNTVNIKGYAQNDFKSVTLSLGIPEIGKKYDAESHIILNLNRNYTAPSNYQITEIIHDQKEKLVNESITSATLSKVKCTPADEIERCIDFEISFVMMAPLTGEVLAISAMDSQYRETVTFINSGVEFVGESLLESQTHVLTQKYSNQHQAETIELTQLDRRYQMWEDQNGYLWTQNEYNSWLQITIPDVTQRNDPATSVMTRNHSNFAGMITQEQDRATLIFDSSNIQGIADEPFTHDEPLRLEKLSDPEVLEILHIQALLAEELLCDCILIED